MKQAHRVDRPQYCLLFTSRAKDKNAHYLDIWTIMALSNKLEMEILTY